MPIGINMPMLILVLMVIIFLNYFYNPSLN